MRKWGLPLRTTWIDVTTAFTDITTAFTDVKDVSTVVTTALTDVKDLSTVVTTAFTDVKDFRTDVTTAFTDEKDLSTVVTTAFTDVKDFWTVITTVCTDVKHLSADITTVSAEFKDRAAVCTSGWPDERISCGRTAQPPSRAAGPDDVLRTIREHPSPTLRFATRQGGSRTGIRVATPWWQGSCERFCRGGCGPLIARRVARPLRGTVQAAKIDSLPVTRPPLNAPDTTGPMLAVARLRFDRNDACVFGPLDFFVHSGEALLVTGGNGAGKTTLLRVLAGLLRAEDGSELTWHGQACSSLPAEGIAFVGHLPGHKADLGAIDNLRFAVGLHGCRVGVCARTALASVGLAGFEDVPAGRLSAGQRKRLALARLLLSPAPLWLLDEPYANLDRDGMTLVDRLLGEHQDAGGAALITTHGAYAAPPVRVRTLLLDAPAPQSRLVDTAGTASA